MKFKKTLFLLILLILLGLVAYLLERPKDVTPSADTFPDFTVDAAALIHIRNKGEVVALVKTDDGWKLEGEQGFPADPDLVKKTLKSIDELKKEHNVVSNNPQNQSLFEVDPNSGIEVKVSGQDDKVLANFFVGKTGPDFMSTYIRKADSDEVLLGEGYHLRSSFTRTAKSWYDLNVCSLPSEQIEKISIIEGDKRLSLKKDQDQWLLIDPNQAPAKKAVVDDMVTTLTRLRANDLLKADTLEEYGLAAPRKQIMVTMSDGSEKKIDIGRQNDKNQYHVKAEKDVVYLVPQYSMNKFSKTFDELKEIPPKEEAKKEGVTPAEGEAGDGKAGIPIGHGTMSESSPSSESSEK
ncbi:MAG: DUF4340 domain-containing protein [bacterium]